MGWREQYESVFGGRRVVECEVSLSPEETLRRLRTHLVSEGSYRSKIDLRDVLEAEDSSHMTSEKLVNEFRLYRLFGPDHRGLHNLRTCFRGDTSVRPG